MPVTCLEKGFVVLSDLVETWIKLEKFLTTVFNAFSIPTALDVIFRPVPNDVGYWKVYKTEVDACNVGRCTLSAI